MSQNILERIVEEAKALTPQEQQKLIALLDYNLARPEAETLAQQQRLLTIGASLRK